MIVRHWGCHRYPLVLLVCGLVWSSSGVLTTAWGQSEARPGDATLRMAERSSPTPSLSRAVLAPAQPNEHPLVPALRWAQGGLRDIEKIHDYSATLVKKERVDGKVGEPEFMFIKVRHNPFSVYMYFLKPDAVKGQEVLYVDGAPKGKMWAHGTGLKKVFGTLELDPKGRVAMQGNRYPITEVGVLNMVRRLIEVGEKDAQYGECEVELFPNTKVNERVCTCVKIVHPVPRRNFLFNVARIFVDDELNVPIRYESYDWPEQAGGQPELIEEYTYLNLKLNVGFTDADFDTRNPNYGFKARK